MKNTLTQGRSNGRQPHFSMANMYYISYTPLIYNSSLAVSEWASVSQHYFRSCFRIELVNELNGNMNNKLVNASNKNLPITTTGGSVGDILLGTAMSENATFETCLCVCKHV